ncbi:DUF4253 domain-containing protein [Luedemannella helvata]|uniref:DUF4253 domain-containing protein n=1 Tax=Luedemannella helvata TaxID=349315 RepID=A0ABP4X081_9ACTN
MTLPQGLDQLFRDGSAASRTLDVALPPGRLVVPDGERTPPHPAYWLSDAAAPEGLWERLRAAHARSGLWPLLLTDLDAESGRPWATGEVHITGHTSPAGHDAEAVLARWWTEINSPSPDDTEDSYPPELAGGHDGSDTFGLAWPGLAAAGALAVVPDRHADEVAAALADGHARLGLVAADRGADALTVAGWSGPVNHTEDTALISAVIRSWEERFGVRVISVGFAALTLSVAAPPLDITQARAVAYEHLAFCPDNVWQGVGSVADYSETILGAPIWSFWWD